MSCDTSAGKAPSTHRSATKPPFSWEPYQKFRHISRQLRVTNIVIVGEEADHAFPHVVGEL